MITEVQKIPWPNWELGDKLGQGSFGSVYEIHRKLVDDDIEKCALKVISIPQNSSDVKDLFDEGYDEESITATFHAHLKSIVTEYSMMKKMDGSANIVSCKDIEYIQHDDGIGWDIYIRMELLTPLMKALPEKIPENEVIKLAKDMCKALVLCKKHEIIHRDIKPQNIFMSPNGDYKLGDFGIAKTVEKTTGGTKIGTYMYMAPEVYNNQPYGCSADIYSLGLVLYWMLNERRMPFMSLPPAKIKVGEREEARDRRLAGEMIPPPLHGSEELKRIVLKACAFDLNERYAAAADMLNDLDKLDVSAGADFEKTYDMYNTFVHFQQTSGNPATEPEKPPEEDPDKTMGMYNGKDFRNAAEPSNDEPEKPPEEDPDKTIGLYNDMHHRKAKEPLKTETGKTPKTEQEKAREPENTEGTDHVANAQQEQKKKSPALTIVLIAAGVVVLIIALLLMLRSCGGDSPASTPVNRLPAVTVNNDVPKQTEQPEQPEQSEQPGQSEQSGQSQQSGKPVQAEWSDWAEKMPDYVSEADYAIEKKTQYSTRVYETTSSTKGNKMDGWELFDTVKGDGGYGAWSDWSETKATESGTKQVEKKTVYRYRTKETTTGTSSSKSGWTLDKDKTTYSWGDFGSWSSWSTKSVSADDNTKVESKKQYRYRDITLVSGYSEWSSWSSWSTTEVSKTDTKDVDERTVYPYYYYYCTECGPSARSAFWGEVRCSSCNKKTIAKDTKTVKWFTSPWSNSQTDEGGKKVQVINGSKYWNLTSESERTEYRYRTRTVTQVEKPGDWSDWSDKAYEAIANKRDVETRTVYRSCKREKIATYHFWRWGSWSNWSDSKSSAPKGAEIDEGTMYRYRDQVTETTYYFRRWGKWSEFTDHDPGKVENGEVRKRTVCRFKSK